MTGFKEARYFLKVGEFSDKLRNFQLAVGLCASYRESCGLFPGASHMVPAVRSTRSCYPPQQRVGDTFGASTAVRVPVSRRDRSQVWTLEQKKANGDRTIHRHRKCVSGELLKTVIQFCQYSEQAE